MAPSPPPQGEPETSEDDGDGRLSPAARVLFESRSRFLRFLEPRVGSAALAEELLQDAYAKALERGGQLREHETAVAWFFRILRNAIVDQRRKHAAADRALERLAGEIEVRGAGHVEMERAVCACVSTVLETLKPEYRDSIRSVDLEGQELKTFAQDAGITASNAAVRLHRARGALGKRLRQTCGACADHGCTDCTCRDGG
jgi:RNA polymerase sigma-70 factor (ECF subfamily)